MGSEIKSFITSRLAIYLLVLSGITVSQTKVFAQTNETSLKWTITLTEVSSAVFDKALRSQPRSEIASKSGQFKKQGALTLPLRNGKHIVLKDNSGRPYDEDRKHYTYYGFIKSLDCYVIAQQLYEGLNYLLINKNDGAIVPLRGVPALSPDGKIMFSTFWNPYEEHTNIQPPSQDLYFSNIANGKISAPYRVSYNKMVIAKFAWETNNSLVMSYTATTEAKDQNLRYARLRINRKK